MKTTLVRLDGVYFGTYNDRAVVIIDPQVATPQAMIAVDEFIRDVAGRRGDDGRRTDERASPVLVRKSVFKTALVEM